MRQFITIASKSVHLYQLQITSIQYLPLQKINLRLDMVCCRKYSVLSFHMAKDAYHLDITNDHMPNKITGNVILILPAYVPIIASHNQTHYWL